MTDVVVTPCKRGHVSGRDAHRGCIECRRLRRRGGLPPAPPPRWTEAAVEKAAGLWAKGFSASQVAAQLGPGFTRNAVIGRLHRLGKARVQREGIASVRENVERRSAGRKPAETRAPRAKRAIASPPIVPRTDERPAATGPAPFPRSSIFICPWIEGDPRDKPIFCCGRPVTRGAYCDAHAGWAYGPMVYRDRRLGKAAG